MLDLAEDSSQVCPSKAFHMPLDIILAEAENDTEKVL